MIIVVSVVVLIEVHSVVLYIFERLVGDTHPVFQNDDKQQSDLERLNTWSYEFMSERPWLVSDESVLSIDSGLEFEPAELTSETTAKRVIGIDSNPIILRVVRV